MKFKQFYENVTYLDKLKSKFNIDKFIGDGLGYSATDKKWYGFTHRAIHGFGVGSKCKFGDVHYTSSNKLDFINNLKNNYNNKMYKNVKIEDCGKYVKMFYEIHNKNGEIFKINRVKRFPKKYGKGEWTAKTLEDAKQMAIDFRNKLK